MKKALKVTIKVACVCGAIGLLLYEVYDTINGKIRKIKHETWHEAWNGGYKSGYNAGCFEVAYRALFNRYITSEQYDKLTEKN